MYKKTITYVDYDGVERTEEFLFNLNKAEVLDWMMTDGDYTLDKVIERMAKKRDGKQIMSSVRDLIYRAYGEKSVDGRRFVKTPEIKANFMETEAYSVLFMELVTDSAKAAEFFNGIMPKDLGEQVDKLMREHPNASPEELRKLAEETVAASK